MLLREAKQILREHGLSVLPPIKNLSAFYDLLSSYIKGTGTDVECELTDEGVVISGDHYEKMTAIYVRLREIARHLKTIGDPKTKRLNTIIITNEVFEDEIQPFPVEETEDVLKRVASIINME